MRLVTLVLAVLLSGCVSSGMDDGTDTSGMDDGTGARTDFTAPDMQMWWQDRSEVHDLLGREAWVEGDRARIAVHEEGIEGGDFGIVLEFRGPMVGTLTYDPELSAQGTFRFQYEEAIFWTGEPVCRVRGVEPLSHLELQAWAPDLDHTAGSFEWWFRGDCPESGHDETRSRHIRGAW